MGVLGIKPAEFWELALPEFWAIYYGRFGRKAPEQPLTMNAVRRWEKKIEEIQAKKKAEKHGR